MRTITVLQCFILEGLCSGSSKEGKVWEVQVYATSLFLIASAGQTQDMQLLSNLAFSE